MIQIYFDFVKQHYNDCEIDQLVMFYNCELQQKNCERWDHHELIELSYHIFGRRQREKTENKASWYNASSTVDGSNHLLFENMFVAASF